MIEDFALGMLTTLVITWIVLVGAVVYQRRVAERHRRAVQENLDWQEKSWRRQQSKEREAQDRSAWRAERQREAEIATDEYLADQTRRLEEARNRAALDPDSAARESLQEQYRRYLNQRNTTEEERHAALRRNAMQAPDDDVYALVIHPPDAQRALCLPRAPRNQNLVCPVDRLRRR